MFHFIKKAFSSKAQGKEAASNPAAEFLQDYETEEQELTVLLKEFTKGGAIRGDFPPCLFWHIWTGRADRRSGKTAPYAG